MANIPAPQTGTNKQPASAEEVNEIADRKLNIEKMMEELEALKKRKEEILKEKESLRQ